MKRKIFISFDYDNDADIKGCLVSQIQNPSLPLEIIDMSINKPIDEKWRNEARERIGKCDVVIVLCGEHTKDAPGVTAELTIARELKIPYILLKGRKKKKVQKPNSSLKEDLIYDWKWKKLIEILIGEKKHGKE